MVKKRKRVFRNVFPIASTARPIGGANAKVQARFNRAQIASQQGDFPLMMANIYSPPSAVALPIETALLGNGMIDRIYQPDMSEVKLGATPQQPRTLGAKIASWIASGVFA